MHGSDLDLDVTNLAALRQRIAQGEVSSLALTEQCLDRIGALDDRVNAVIELNPDAADIAERLDGALKESGPVGPLHGLPILIKDNIDTGDRMTTTAGSLALEGSIPQQGCRHR